MERSPMWALRTPGPKKSPARASTARTRPASWAASAWRHMSARTRPLVPVADSGVDSVMGASTWP